jgi:arginase
VPSERSSRNDLMPVGRRELTTGVAGARRLSPPVSASHVALRTKQKRAIAPQSAGRPLDLINSPTNLGLRPNPADELVGTWRAAEALADAGLSRCLLFRSERTLTRREYDRNPQSGTRIRNGRSLRAYSFELARAVQASLSGGGFPLVVGGDCSNVIGGMLGLRRSGGRGLVHIDGHSDFFHPGNYDAASRLGSAAGMDLALVTGRGEPILTRWPAIGGPLVEDADVIQIGEREAGDADYPFHEIARTEICQYTIQQIRQRGLPATIDLATRRLRERDIATAWLHLDVDVLDQSVMPAVDCPGSPGLVFEELEVLVAELLRTGRIAGADVAIYDPDLDRSGIYAKGLVDCLAAAFGKS